MCSRLLDNPFLNLARPNLFHILLVEPDLDHADLIAMAIERHNTPFYLHHAPNSEQALQFLNKQHPHTAAPTPQLILLDLNLAKVRGQELLVTLKSDEQFLNIPTVVLTQDPTDTPLPNKHRLQTNAYHPKPESAQQFENLVNDVNKYWRQWRHEPLQNISAA